MKPFEGEMVPGFQNVREKGLNLIDASELHQLPRVITAARSVSGDFWRVPALPLMVGFS